MADLRAGGAIPLPGGFFGAFDQAAIGHAILDPGEAGDVMDLIQQHETQDLANPGTVWRKYKVWASCGFAVCTMVSARSRRSWSS